MLSETRMGTIHQDSSHSPLDHPKVFLSARLRLLQLAAWSGFSAFSPNPEPSGIACYRKPSGCPLDWFLRTALRGRNSRSVIWNKSFDLFFDTMCKMILRPSFIMANFQKPRFLPIQHFSESTFKWTFDGEFAGWWTLKASFLFQLRLFLNADPKIRLIRY